jgi:DNA/RNA-binding domain of Phe-tRNA-synthetase-like protein
MDLIIETDLKIRFPELYALTLNIDGVNIKKRDPDLETFKVEIMTQIRDQYTLDSVKDNPTFRAYRKFFWSIGIDPTKNRPAAEALTRRVLAGKMLPCINTLVDVYNLASIKTRIALATFDADKLDGKLLMRSAKEDEHILGIGMEKPMILRGGEIVISDQKELIAIYPYRDADNTKVTEQTKNVSIIICGVPGISKDTLKKASRLTHKYITRFCNGKNE